MVKRFYGMVGLQWCMKHNPKMGEVIAWREDSTMPLPKYCPMTRTSFCNIPPRKEVLHRGTTHVAVGFNDLSVLLVCDLQDPPGDRAGPLVFKGVDMSSYSVAKSAVVTEMLRQADVPLEQY